MTSSSDAVRKARTRPLVRKNQISTNDSDLSDANDSSDENDYSSDNSNDESDTNDDNDGSGDEDKRLVTAANTTKTTATRTMMRAETMAILRVKTRRPSRAAKEAILPMPPSREWSSRASAYYWELVSARA